MSLAGHSPTADAGRGMPPSLKALVCLTDNIAPRTEVPWHAYAEAAHHPASTQELLQQADALYGDFCRMVELLSAAGPGQDSAAAARQMEAAGDDFAQRVSQLQLGIRSKVGQCARFAMVQHLKQEIHERQLAVLKIESVLEAMKEESTAVPSGAS